MITEVTTGELPQIHGYELPSRSRGTLRTERILQIEAIEELED